MKNVGIELKYESPKWYQLDSIKKAKRLADKCAEFSGRQHHVIPFAFGKGCMIINSLWKDKYNKKVPRAARLSMPMVKNQAYYSTSLK